MPVYTMAQYPKPHQRFLSNILGGIVITEELPPDGFQTGAKLSGNMFKLLAGHAASYTHQHCKC